MKTRAILFFYLFTGPYLMAADIPPDAKPLELSDFSGGLNTTIAPHKLDPKYSPDLQNVFMHRKAGSVIRSKGFVTVGSTNTLLDGRFGFTAYSENGVKEFIVSDSSMLLSTQDFQTYIFISSNLTTTVGLNALQVRNKVWITNGVDPVINWNLSTHVKQVLNGTNGLPNVPKFRYMALLNERVLGVNTSADASSLDFCSLTVSTSGEIIAPDDPRAWPATNRIEIGQGDGQVITSIWVYNGRGYIGKERSIYVLLDSNLAPFRPYKIEPQVGVASHDSVVVMDGLTYFKGPNGGYKFDGTRAIRITDGITPDMEVVNDAVNKTVSNSWETKSDFERGLFITSSNTARGVYNSTATDDGFLRVVVGTTQVTFVPASMTSTQTLIPTVNPTFIDNIVTTVAFSANMNGYLVKHYFNWSQHDNGGFACGVAGVATIRVTYTNASNGNTFSSQHSHNTGQCDILKLTTVTLPTNLFPINGYVIAGGSFTIKYEHIGTPVSDNNAQVYPSTQSAFYFAAYTTGSFISDVATITTLTSWGQFESEYETNGGQVDFFVRTSTHPTNISTRPWSAATPGTIINAPTDERYVQWSASFTSNGLVAPEINNVNISHIEGSSNRERPFAIEWNREYWLSIATGTNNTSIQYVKSWITNPNPDAWNRLKGINIRSFFKDGNSVLYAGAANSGTFYRLDFGTNYDGEAIQSYYDSPDLTFSNDYTKKKLFEVWMDVERSAGGTFDVGLSSNGGTFGYKQFSMDGTGRMVKAVKGYGNQASSFRFKFQNNELDKTFTLHNAQIWYLDTEIRDE